MDFLFSYTWIFFEISLAVLQSSSSNCFEILQTSIGILLEIFRKNLYTSIAKSSRILQKISQEFFREFLYTYSGNSSKNSSGIPPAISLDFIKQFLRNSSGFPPRIIPDYFQKLLSSLVWSVSRHFSEVLQAIPLDFFQLSQESSSEVASIIPSHFLLCFLQISPEFIKQLSWSSFRNAHGVSPGTLPEFRQERLRSPPGISSEFL